MKKLVKKSKKAKGKNHKNKNKDGSDTEAVEEVLATMNT